MDNQVSCPTLLLYSWWLSLPFAGKSASMVVAAYLLCKSGDFCSKDAGQIYCKRTRAGALAASATSIPLQDTGHNLIVRSDHLKPTLHFSDSVSRHHEAWQACTYLASKKCCINGAGCRSSLCSHHDDAPGSYTISIESQFCLLGGRRIRTPGCCWTMCRMVAMAHLPSMYGHAPPT